MPAVSPDGQWVAFWAARAIRKVPLGGGPVHGPRVGYRACPRRAWSGTPRRPAVLRQRRRPHLGDPGRRDAGAGHDARRGGGRRHTLPWLAAGRPGAALHRAETRVVVGRRGGRRADARDRGPQGPAARTRRMRATCPTGHLVFLRRGVLFAVPFDVRRCRSRATRCRCSTGSRRRLTHDTANFTGAGQFAVASTGSLAWLRRRCSHRRFPGSSRWTATDA